MVGLCNGDPRKIIPLNLKAEEPIPAAAVSVMTQKLLAVRETDLCCRLELHKRTEGAAEPSLHFMFQCAGCVNVWSAAIQ